jgi:hypothetical protein
VLKRILVATLACVGTVSACSPPNAEHQQMQRGAVVTTDMGPVRGTVAERCRVFQGMPISAVSTRTAAI